MSRGKKVSRERRISKISRMARDSKGRFLQDWKIFKDVNRRHKTVRELTEAVSYGFGMVDGFPNRLDFKDIKAYRSATDPTVLVQEFIYRD